MTDTRPASDACRPALLVVDVQVGVMAQTIDRDRVIATIAGLVERARAADVPVVWVRHHDDELERGSDEWQIVGELTPAAGETVVEKTYGDSFADTDLSGRLRDLGVDGILLCGAMSDMCIRSTLFGALYRGWPVTLVTDAHTTEDLRPWGVDFAPEQAVAVVNAMAAHTALPGLQSRTCDAARAL